MWHRRADSARLSVDVRGSMETKTISHETSAAEEQRRLLRESARAFAKRELSPRRYRELRSLPVPFESRLWKALAELGWTGLMLPEAYGGSGLGVVESTAVMEELGRFLLPEPLVASAFFAGSLITEGDNEELKKRLLPSLCAGKLIPSVAFQESLQARGPIGCQAEISGSGATLSGRKRFVRPCSGADGFVVCATTSAGLGLYWVTPDLPGLSISHERSADGGDAGVLALDKVKIEPSSVLTSPRLGQAAFDKAFDYALLAASAELVGLMRGALDMTLAYLRTRVQFGKPIGSFQALQHRAVDLYVQQELSAAAVAEVAAQFDAEPGMSAVQRAAGASRVKARCSDAALLITREAIQMHGAMGFTDECDIGLYLKRALVLSGWLGNSREHRARYLATTGIGAGPQ